MLTGRPGRCPSHAPGRTRTCDRRIRNPLLDSVSSVTAKSYKGKSATPTYSPDTCALNQPDDPDLRRIVGTWPTLPEHVRQAILLLVRSAGQGAQP